MNIRLLLVASTCALATLASSALISPSFAQTTPAEKAQAALGAYVAVIGVSKTCNFEVAKEAKDAITSNMKALQPISQLDDAAIGAAIQSAAAKTAEKKDTICTMNPEQFEGYVAKQTAIAATLGADTGAKLLPIPAASATIDPKKAATDLLILSYLLEAVAEECDDIELTDAETARLEKAQTFLRGQTGYTEEQITALSDTMEKEASKGKKEFCSPAFDFKGQLKTVFDATK